MKKLNIAALFLGATLFIGLSAVSLQANDMKCSACQGVSKVQKPMKKMKCCAGKCNSAMHKQKRSMGSSCSSGKCANAYKKKNKAMKRSACKCASNK